MVSPIIALRMTLNSFSPSPLLTHKVAKRTTVCLAYISAWMMAHHLKLNIDKMELLFLPGKACPLQDLSIKVDNPTVSTSQSARTLV